MPIDYNLLQPQQPGKIIAQLQANPSGGDSSGGIGDLLSGLASFAHGLMPTPNPTPALTGQNMGGGAGVNPGYNPQSPSSTLSNIFSGNNTQQTPNQSPNLNISQIRGNNSGTLHSLLGQPDAHQTIWDNASKQLGFSSKDPTLRSYLQKANPGLDPTSTPWCAGYVGSVLNASGLKGTGSLAAKSYLNYGTPTDKPTQGDIVVFNDLTGRNDPAHGHVGFVQNVDPKNGMVSVLGGNQSGAVSVKSYPLSSVAGFRTPPSGQQVQQFAQTNNINDPIQLANITKQPIDSNQTPNQSPNSDGTVGLIKQFEGFEPSAKWDVNAHRLGYGSDTITKADGSVIPVRPGDKVTREDADRDLARRIPQFQQTASKQVGSDTWNGLPSNAQSALTSMTYNYGSLPKNVVQAVKSGNLPAVAEAIKAHAGDNGGVNRDRRYKEAQYLTSPSQSTAATPMASNTPVNAPSIPTEQYNDAVRGLDKGLDLALKGDSGHFTQMAMNSRANPTPPPITSSPDMQHRGTPIRDLGPDGQAAIMKNLYSENGGVKWNLLANKDSKLS